MEKIEEQIIRKAKELENNCWKFVRVERRTEGIFAIYQNPRTHEFTETKFKITFGGGKE